MREVVGRKGNLTTSHLPYGLWGHKQTVDEEHGNPTQRLCFSAVKYNHKVLPHHFLIQPVKIPAHDLINLGLGILSLHQVFTDYIHT